MEYGDYSPPAWPSPEQQRDALQKGMGRALRWARERRLDDDPLLAACLCDQRFDSQIDSTRGDWLWEMVRAVGAVERFRVPILHALYDLPAESAQQLCELARRYARAGDETFRTRLYEIVDQKPVLDCPWLGEDDIITLDGESAFLFAARARGKSLAGRQWEWDDSGLADLAAKHLGDGRVSMLLDATQDDAIRQFRDGWRGAESRRSPGGGAEAHKQRMRAIPVEEVLRAAATDQGAAWLRGWGMHADPADLRIVLERLWVTREPRNICHLLRVFSARALEEFDARLLNLCRHGNEEVRRRALTALGRNTHPLVREFALVELWQGVHDGSVVGLFVNNYQPGDEHRILESLTFTDDPCEVHWLLMAAVKVLEQNPDADSSRLGVVSYALTPCANCRFRAVQLLLLRQAAPEWLRRECQDDAEEDCRALVRKNDPISEPA